MDNDDIKVLKRLSENLKNLMDDPHPSTVSWNRAVATTIKHISDYEDG